MAYQGGQGGQQSNKRSFSSYDNKKSNDGKKSWGDNKKSYDGKKPYDNKKSWNDGKKPYDRDFKGKGKFTPKPAAAADEPKRKRPITAGGGEEELDYDEVEADGDIEMGEAGGEPAEKKPRMSKSEKAAMHAAQPHRTALLPSFPLLQEILPLWETARQTEIPKDERTKAVKELYQAVKGRILEISKGHKGGRVLQTIVKYGGKEERNGVAMELQPQWRQMMESKYSKFLMGKLIRYCPVIRPLLIPALTPHLTSLLFHADAVQPLSDFFDLWASSKERKLLVRGFYPKEVQIFDGLRLAKGKGVDVDGEAKGLAGSLEDMGDEGKGRERVLNDVEKTIADVFNAPQKGALAQGIFHRLVAEYLDCVYRYLGPEDASTKMHALLEVSLESLPDIVHTKDGSAVVRTLIARGNAKDRKQILGQLRKHVEAMSKDGDAQMVLFTAFDCVDDTKLMGKTFVTDLAVLGGQLASDKIGRRSLLYPVTPTSTKHYIPSILSSLAASAEIAREAGTSKKDPETRRKELLFYASPGLISLIADKGEEMVRDAGSGLVVQEAMLLTTGDKSKAIETLVKPLSVPYVSTTEEEEDETAHILDLPHAVRTYRTLLCGGHFSHKTNSIDLVAPELRTIFAKAAWKAIGAENKENAVKIALGEGTFVIAELVQALVDAGAAEVEEVKKVLGAKEVISQLEASERNGAGLLVEKLKAL